MPATPTKVADRATLNSDTGATTFDYALASLTVGNVLIIRVAADNSGGSGAARTLTVTNQSGTPIDTGTDLQYTQLMDPAGASAGVCLYVVVATITATAGTVRLTFSGSVVQAGVAEEWSGIDTSAPVVGTPVGNTDNTGNLASCTDASVASGNLAYGAIAAEGPQSDTYTQDADTTNGSWSNLTKAGGANATPVSNVTTYGGYKVVSATGAQTYNPTINNARDSAGLIIEFAAAPSVVDATLAAPLGGLTATATATPEHPATLAAPLGGLTAALSADVTAGAPTVDAVLDAPLGGLTATATATPEHPATLAAPLGELTATLNATPEHPATLAAPLGALTASATATPEHLATLAAPLGSLSAALSATVEAGDGEPEPEPPPAFAGGGSYGGVTAFPNGVAQGSHSIPVAITISHIGQATLRGATRTHLAPVAIHSESRHTAATTIRPLELSSAGRCRTETRLANPDVSVHTTVSRSADVLAAVAAGLWQQRSNHDRPAQPAGTRARTAGRTRPGHRHADPRGPDR